MKTSREKREMFYWIILVRNDIKLNMEEKHCLSPISPVIALCTPDAEVYLNRSNLVWVARKNLRGYFALLDSIDPGTKKATIVVELPDGNFKVRQISTTRYVRFFQRR